MPEFLPDTDNFFKYLLTIGLILIAFVIVYPVQQQKEVDIEINGYLRDAKILDYRIQRLKDDVGEFKFLRNSTQHRLDSLKNLMKISVDLNERDRIEVVRNNLKNEFDKKRNTYDQIVDTLYILNVTLDYGREKIKKLSGYFSFFKSYKIVFLICGVLTSILGLVYWCASVYREELKKDKEIDQDYRSFFVKHCIWVSLRLKKQFVIVVLVIILVVLLTFMVIGACYN